jgi:Flp pilus assembly protein TadD
MRLFLLLVALVASAPAVAVRAEDLDPARAARLAEAERAIGAGRYDEAQAMLDELDQGLEVEEPVLAARLDLALRRAGLSEPSGAAAAVPPDVTSAAAALERHGEIGHRACILLADEALAAGRLDAAAEWLARALVAMPGDDHARLRLALLQMGRGKAGEAAALALELLPRQPRCPGILQLAGQGLLAEGRSAEAIPILERLVAVTPEAAEARSLLGTALLVERRMPEAVEQLRRAAELDPTPVRRSNLALALTYGGAADEAVEILERLTIDRPDDGGAWVNYGIALVGMGRLDDARAAFQKALAVDPDDERARTNLSDLEEMQRGPR